MWSLDQGGGAAGQNPATSPAVFGRGRGWEGSRGRERPTCGSSLGRDAAGQGERRGSVVPAAVTGERRRGGGLGDQSVARGLQGVLEEG
jgi:hypothetical protein